MPIIFLWQAGKSPFQNDVKHWAESIPQFSLQLSDLPSIGPPSMGSQRVGIIRCLSILSKMIFFGGLLGDVWSANETVTHGFPMNDSHANHNVAVWAHLWLWPPGQGWISAPNEPVVWALGIDTDERERFCLLAEPPASGKQTKFICGERTWKMPLLNLPSWFCNSQILLS